MTLPTESAVILYLAKVTVTFVVGLILVRFLRRDIKTRQIVWLVCFFAPLWLLLPLPPLKIALFERHEVAHAGFGAAAELGPGFQPFDPSGIRDPGPSLLLLLVVGAALAGWIVLSLRWVATIRLIRAAEQVVDDELVSLLYELGQQRKLSDVPMLKMSDSIDSPCVWGVHQPVIVVPTSFADLEASEWKMALDHEIVHLSQSDPLRILFFSLVQHALWWNPLVWMAIRDATLTQEHRIDRVVGSSKGYTQLLMRTMVPATGNLRLRLRGQGHLLTRVRALQEPSERETGKFGLLGLAAFAPIYLPLVPVNVYQPNPRTIGFDEVIFSSDRSGKTRLWRMSNDGRNPLPMADRLIGAGSPEISPDGEWLAFHRQSASGKEDLFVARIDGSEERCIVSTPGRDVQASWSPDGSKLVYCTLATGKWEIGLHVLATGKNSFVTKDGMSNLEPSFHPNGQRIVFASRRAGPQNLWSMNLDGTELTKLTSRGVEDTHATYSKDGRKLLFAGYRRGKYDIFLLDLGPGTYRVLTPLSLAEAGEPEFANNDDAIVYSGNDGSGLQLRRIDLSSGGLDVFPSSGNDFWPETR